MKNVAMCGVVLALAGCGESQRTSETGSGGVGASGEVGASGGVSGGATGGVGASGGVSGGATGGVGASGGIGARGGVGGEASGGGGASGGGSSGAGGSSGEFFISALVDGVPLRVENGVRAYWFQGLLDGWLGLEGNTYDRAFNFVVMNALTSNACSYVVLGDLPRTVISDRGSFVEGGSCAVTVTKAAPNVGDVYEGTFEATVGTIGVGELVVLTEGRFRAPRVEDNSPPGP